MTVRLARDARRASEILLGIRAIGCNLETPFKLTSGRLSPVYIDCRKIISFVAERREIITMIVRMLDGVKLDVVAGGETAGIPYGAWVAEALNLPMVYVRKKPKAMGRREQIEGELKSGQRCVLVEDLATDGGSKINFLEALRRSGASVEHSTVVFYYGIFPGAEETFREAGITLHALTNWKMTIDVAGETGYFDAGQVKGIREFLDDPEGWSRSRGEPRGEPPLNPRSNP